MKRFFCLLSVFVFFGSVEPAGAASSVCESRAADTDQVLFEKPKPGSKRWLRQQRNVRNTRKKKYPRMRRGREADWTFVVSDRPK